MATSGGPDPPLYTPYEMRQILMEALSSPVPPHDQPPQENSDYDGDGDDNELPCKPGRNAPHDPPAASPSSASDSSSPAPLIDLSQHGPVMHNKPTLTSIPKLPLPTPLLLHGPTSSSPLRHVTNDSELSHSHEYNSSPPPTPSPRPHLFSTPKPVRAMPALPVTPVPSSSASARQPDHHPHTPQTFQVEASFLQAMIGLLQRQANIVPEHLFTADDVREIVCKELRKQEARVRVPEVICEDTTWPMVAISCGVCATMGGAFLGLFRRAYLAHPALAGRLLGGALRGAGWGLAGMLVAQGILKVRRVGRESGSWLWWFRGFGV